MKRIALAFICCLPMRAQAQSLFDTQTLAAADALRARALADERAYEWVQGLVNTAPRRFAGTPASAKAIAWALQELQARGFVNVHSEPVEVPHWVRGDISVSIGGSRSQALTAVAIGGSTATPETGIEAPVLMVTSLDDLEARPLAEIKNKIVFFNKPMSPATDGSNYGDTVPARAKGPSEAGRRGALAVVIRSVGTSRGAIAHTGANRYDDAAPKIPAAALSNDDADVLAARIVAGEPVQLRLRITSRKEKPVQAANVIGEIPGETDEIVLLAAHLDSWDITPGANDDGAGTAIVVEAARLIGALTKKPHRTIRVLLTANEEFGLSGAKAYVRAHAGELPRHVLAMEADFGSGAVLNLDSGVPAAAQPLVENILAALAPLAVRAGKSGEAGGADVGKLFERGVPTLDPRQDGTRYFDVHHTMADTLDKIDREGLKQNVAVYAVAAYLAAQSRNGFGRVPFTAAD